MRRRPASVPSKELGGGAEREGRVEKGGGKEMQARGRLCRGEKWVGMAQEAGSWLEDGGPGEG